MLEPLVAELPERGDSLSDEALLPVEEILPADVPPLVAAIPLPAPIAELLVKPCDLDIPGTPPLVDALVPK